MATVIVVSNPSSWPFELPGVDIVSAREYLTDPKWFDERGAKVFNFCRSYGYQTLGYYVSLLAEARGHRSLPSISTIQDLKSASIVRVVSEDLDELVQRGLKTLRSSKFELSIYFGRNLAKHYDTLSARIFQLFPAPLLRVSFTRKGEKWRIGNISLISGSDVPDGHRGFVADVASQYFEKRLGSRRRRQTPRYDLAILHDPEEEEPPSDEKALSKFVKVARTLGVAAELIGKDDYGRLAEFDALFIRETTAVNHHTYRFSRRAQEEGLAVIDDPDSILRCTNKVYLAELLARYRVGRPKTIVTHRDNVEELPEQIGFPIILKRPDSAFSRGVVKVDVPEELDSTVREFLEDSDLLIAQEFQPTPFDWRVGVLDGRPLYVCKYHMARRHWQIIDWKDGGSQRYGRVEAVPVGRAPSRVVKTAVRAAGLIGDGLYGVDVKEVDRRAVVIEVNDNPTLEAGLEDAILGDELYRSILSYLIERVDARRAR